MVHESHLKVCPCTGLLIDVHSPRPHRPGGLQRQVAPEQAAARLIGQLVGDKYKVISLIGRGGMSTVYEALHVGLNRSVALKVLHPGLSDDDEQAAFARLRHEAEVVSAIGHPNICEVYDLGVSHEGSPYLVVERLVGETLAEWFDCLGALSFLEIGAVARQILDALAATHSKGVVHRDLKPHNIFLERRRSSSQPRCKLLDFGISTSGNGQDPAAAHAPHAQPGWVVGTPYYMAPEQARGDSALDHRVDLWAVGVILYEALTGRRPFVATNYNALLVQILTAQPRPVQRLRPQTHHAVVALVDRALAKARENRFQTATEFKRAIVEAERLCTAEDPRAPTMRMVRGARPQDPRDKPSSPAGQAWHEAIEDPATFIDDESEVDDESETDVVGRTVVRVDVDKPPHGPMLAVLSDSSLHRRPRGKRPPPAPSQPSTADESRTRIHVRAELRRDAVKTYRELVDDKAAAEDTDTTLVVPRKPTS